MECHRGFDHSSSGDVESKHTFPVKALKMGPLKQKTFRVSALKISSIVFFTDQQNKPLKLSFWDCRSFLEIILRHNHVYMGWNYPPPSNSDHQDYYMFNRESL